jgi:hypothetical protein
MKIQRSAAIWSRLLVLLFILVATCMVGKEKDSNKYVCSETNPQGMCNASTTCGSAGAPCMVDIKRTANAASVTASIPGAKDNAPFCVKVGTKVSFKSESKNVGFVLDFGASSPFGQGTIIGGSNRPVSVVANKPGCFKFSAGACVSGAIYGMCGETNTEIIVTGGN